MAARPTPTRLRKALDKQRDGDWTGGTSNPLRDQVQVTFAAFWGFFLVFFLELHMGKMGQVSADPVKVPGTPSLHTQQWQPVVPLRPPRAAGKSETIGRNAKKITVSLCYGLPDRYGSAPVGLVGPLGFISIVAFRRELPYRHRAEAQAAQRSPPQPPSQFPSTVQENL